MITSWLTLRDLEYLVAVARHEHFGKAANECHVSQPSLSTQIKKIEGYLGITLFERTNRRVQITEIGLNVAEQAQLVLLEARKIEALIGVKGSDTFEQLKIGVISSLSPIIPQILIGLKKDFPKAKLTLQEGLTENLTKELKSGQLDIIIAADTIKDATLKIRRLFFEPFVLAAPVGSSILEKVKIRTGDLKMSEMVLLEEGHCLSDQIEDFCPINTRGQRKSYHANSIETLRHLVASGAGYTLLPKMAVENQPIGKLIFYREFDNLGVGRNVVAVFRSQSEGLISYRKLIQTLENLSAKFCK